MRTGASLLAALCLAGCGDGGTGNGDAGVADGATDAGATSPATPPDIPWLADGLPSLALTPCPGGWRDVTDPTGIAACDPYPEAGPDACAPGEAHFPGEPACRPIGDPCPPGDYAAGLPTDTPVLYVRPGAAAGGDGSLAAPYARLADVPWSTLAAATTVALSKGTHSGRMPVRAGVRVVGACVADTIVTSTDATAAAVATAASAGEPAVLRNVTIRDAPIAGVSVGLTRAFSLTGVLVERVATNGVVVEGAGSRLFATDVVVRDTRSAAGDIARGLQAWRGAHLEATRVIVSGSLETGVAIAERASAVLADVVVRGTRGRPSDRQYGFGLVCVLGATVEGSRVLVDDNRELGIFVTGADTSVVLTDSIVRDTDAKETDGTSGRGIAVANGGRFEGTRMLVSGNRDTAVDAYDTGSSLVLTDTLVRDTRSVAAWLGEGRGLTVENGARLEGTRVVSARNRDVGAFASGAGAVLVLTDAALLDTVARERDGADGRGLVVQFGADLQASRVLVSGSREVGVLALEDATMTMTDVVVRDTAAREADGAFGYGIAVQGRARLTLERVVVERARELGLVAIQDGVVDARHVAVRHVAASDNPMRVFGYAVAAVGGGVRLADFEVRDAATCGLFVSPQPGAGEPALDVERGVVAQASIGACIQVDGYDVGRLERDVAYVDNDRNLDSVSLPIPEPLGSPSSP